MNKHFLIMLLVSLVTIPTMAQKQQKSKSSNQSAPKTVYIKAKDRNYAQNLGGYWFYDYTFKESHGLYTQCPCQRQEKQLIAQYSYQTYDEAYKNMLTFPKPADVDTREKLTYWHDCVIAAINQAIYLYESEPEFEAEAKRLQKKQMDNAKLAARGKPFDTIPFDPKAREYNKILEKIRIIVPVQQLYTDVVTEVSTSDPDLVRWLQNSPKGCHPRFAFNAYSPLVKQIIKEWFMSEECKQVQKIEDELRARVAAEQPKMTPDWFVEGRKREGELVAQYNRRLVDRWIKKAPMVNINKTKDAIAKVMVYYKEIKALHGNDPITLEYISTHVATKDVLRDLFHCYYSNLELPIPLVRTPDTQEGKKLKLEGTPWTLPHPLEPRE